MLHWDDGPNAVDRTLEYSRPFRALKLWLALPRARCRGVPRGDRRQHRPGPAPGETIRAHPELELVVAEPQLSTVPFRHVRRAWPTSTRTTCALVEALQHDSRVYVSSASIDGRACLRPCIVNFRTTAEDVQALVDVAVELGRSLAVEASTT